MMAAADRFLTLMRVVPGCVAVQCGSGEDGAEESGGRRGERGRRADSESEREPVPEEEEEVEEEEEEDGAMDEEDAARLLVAAHLIRGRGFGAAEALAWTRMAHPAAAAGAAPGLVLLRGGRAGAASVAAAAE